MENLEYANAVFKDAALLQSKLNDSNVQNEGLRKDLFQKQLENEDLRQRLQILECPKSLSRMHRRRSTRKNIRSRAARVDTEVKALELKLRPLQSRMLQCYKVDFGRRESAL